MTARTHDIIAFASLITASVYFPPSELTVPTIFSCVIGNIVGSLIPDMDQASNRLWDLFPAGDFVGKVFRRMFWSHRTLSHSLLGFTAIYKVTEFLLPKFLNSNYVDVNLVFASVMIGVASHLVADSMTKEGIPLFFPLKFKVGIPPLEFLRVRTGSWVENLVVLPTTVVYLAWFVNEHQVELLKTLSLALNQNS